MTDLGSDAGNVVFDIVCAGVMIYLAYRIALLF